MGANGSTDGFNRGLLDTVTTVTQERLRNLSLRTGVGRGQGISTSSSGPTMEAVDGEEHETDSTETEDETSSNSGSEIILYPRRQEDLISVFQQLVRRFDHSTSDSGQINVLSSGSEDSDVDAEEIHVAGLPETRHKAARVPKIKYQPDIDRIQKNDIALQQQVRLAGEGRSFPQLLTSRELGTLASPSSGIDKPHRTMIASKFLPNSVRKIANYGYKAFCGHYSKDGDVFSSACQDRSIRIYDTSRGQFKEFKRISARDVGWSVLDTAFSPDGRYIAYSSWSESIHICNIYGEQDHHETLSLCPDTRRFCIFSIAFSDSGTEILGGSNDGFLYIYDRNLGQRVLRIFAHNDDVNCVTFADETSNILFSVADDGLTKVWDRRSLNEIEPKPVGIMAGHIDGITCVESKKDGRYFLTNSKDQSMKLWDMRVFSSEVGLENTRRALVDLKWDYRWQRVPKRLCVQRKLLEGDTSVMTYRGHSVLNTLIRCHFSPNFSTGQRYVYTGCAAGRIVIYDLLTGEIETVLKGHRACVRDVSWHPYLPELVSSSWDNTIGLWTYEGKHAMDDTEAGVLGIRVNDDDDPPSKRPNLSRSRRSSTARYSNPMQT